MLDAFVQSCLKSIQRLRGMCVTAPNSSRRVEAMSESRPQPDPTAFRCIRHQFLYVFRWHDQKSRRRQGSTRLAFGLERYWLGYKVLYPAGCRCLPRFCVVSSRCEISLNKVVLGVNLPPMRNEALFSNERSLL